MTYDEAYAQWGAFTERFVDWLAVAHPNELERKRRNDLTNKRLKKLLQEYHKEQNTND